MLPTFLSVASLLPPPPPPPPPPYHPPPHLLSLFASSLSFLFLLLKPSPNSSPTTSSSSSSSAPPRRRLLLLRRRRSSFSSAAPMRGRSPPPLSFSTPDSLSAYLRPRLPSGALASWGVVPGTKTLHNLFLELAHGESSLLLPPSPHPHPPPPPVRTVRVVAVRIRNPLGAILVETRQLLSDGSIRERWRPLSEKMRPGESPEEAAARAVREELGEGAVVRVAGGQCDTRVEERESSSYPGLKARYVLHTVEAVAVDGLPKEGEFETEETGEGVEESENAVAVRRHYWKWVDEDQLCG